MSIHEFASHLGVSERTISTWEARGKGAAIRAVNQFALATSLERAGQDVQNRFVLAIQKSVPFTASGGFTSGLGDGLRSVRKSSGEHASQVGNTSAPACRADSSVHYDRSTIYPTPLLRGVVDVIGESNSSELLIRVGQILPQEESLPILGSHFNRLVEELSEWARRMNRRDLLSLIARAAGAAAATPLLSSLDVDERVRVINAITQSTIDSNVVSHIDAVLWRCMRQDDMLGPQAALDTVLAQMALAEDLVPGTRGNEELHKQTLVVYANLSRFAGWLSFDLGNFVAASYYYEKAREAAHEAEHTELGTFILCNMSHLATWRGQPRIGIDHARAAQGWAMETDDLQLRAYSFDVAARAFARNGQYRDAMLALEHAEEALAAVEFDSQWAYFYNLGQLKSTRGSCLFHLRRMSEAAQMAEESLKSIDPLFIRNLAMTCVELSTARLKLEKPKAPNVTGASEALADAIRLSQHNRSTRLSHLIHDGIRELQPWSNDPSARETLNLYKSLR